VYTLVPLGFFLTSIPLPAWLMLVYWMVIQFFGGLQSVGAAGGTAFWAHIGGFVAGVVLIKLFARRDYMEQHGAHHWRPQHVGWNRSQWR
jgi:membrane associated rhomboid family serine protease